LNAWRGIGASFLGSAPGWYKRSLFALLLLNVLLYATLGPQLTAWCIVLEFIFTLAMALQCHPLAPGGLLALQAVLLGLVTPEQVYAETLHGFPVILLLIFMVSAIWFMRDFLIELFARALGAVRSPTLLALLFCGAGALLSAFLDALTVLAVIVTVASSLYRQYDVPGPTRTQLAAALRGLVMHAAVGSALGGVSTLVGEPQNLLIGHEAGWDFQAFFVAVAPVSLPVLATGLVTCVLLERLHAFGYGVAVPEAARALLQAQLLRAAGERDAAARFQLRAQGACAVLLAVALGLHWAEVGLIGLLIVVLLAALRGVVEEERLAEGFKNAMPFVALLVVFFAIVAMIHAQGLFAPVVDWALGFDDATRPAVLYLATGALSSISDNVFVATIYIGEVKRALLAGALSQAQFETLAVAINTGTNIPSVATPNGQAAFLFLLTSALAPLIGLSYGRMVWMALPYFVVMTGTGLLAVLYLLH
jgi:NhaB family Na+:H+ antiporter